ncbi:YqzL family protein [Pseudogracilibacillus auburnensis]
MIWNLFLQTGNVETYLLLKQLENEQLDERNNTETESEEIASFQTKM